VIRAVIDTNVLVSGLLSPAGNEALIVLSMLQRKREIFRPEESPVVFPDPADTKFLYCAQAAKAESIVTGNKRDFPDGSYGSARVVSAGELLDRITEM
jgi:predicted nucleic acid-binding protein